MRMPRNDDRGAGVQLDSIRDESRASVVLRRSSAAFSRAPQLISRQVSRQALSFGLGAR